MTRSIAAAAALACAVGTLSPSTSAMAKKDVPVTHIGYEQWSTAAEFAEGTFAGTVPQGDGVAFATASDTFTYDDPFGDGTVVTYDVATWTSPEVTPGFDLTELVASWNADTPPGTWIQVSVSGTADDGTRSKEYILGRWAEETESIHRTSVPAQGDELATVAIDTLVTRTDRSLSTWRLSVSFYREQGLADDVVPSMSLVSAMASRLPEKVKRLPASPSGGAEGLVLDVPAYSQELHLGEYPEYNGGGEAWCSPTSTSMVMAYWAQQTGNDQYVPDPSEYAWVDPSYDDPWVDHAAANTFDWNYDGTGNWPFNTAYAARYHLESFVTRLRSLTEAEQFIKAGIPLVVSVSFKESELDGAGYGTNGHLMVIVGFTADGDVVVNDPASGLIPSNDEVRRTYDREQFENVWVPHSGGIVYVIRPADVPLPPAPAEANW
jgi:hypothetical protein